MDAVKRFFLQAQHWQVFAVLVGFGCVTEVVVIYTYPKADSVTVPITSLIAAEIYYVCVVLWFWSLSSYLQSVIKPELRLNFGFLCFALSFPLIYMAFFQIIFERLITSPRWMFGVFPLHLMAMFCVLFVLNFSAKSLVLAEKGVPVSFRGYAREFFLFWFFPVGIWFLQPRINRLYAEAPCQPTA